MRVLGLIFRAYGIETPDGRDPRLTHLLVRLTSQGRKEQPPWHGFTKLEIPTTPCRCLLRNPKESPPMRVTSRSPDRALECSRRENKILLSK